MANKWASLELRDTEQWRKSTNFPKSCRGAEAHCQEPTAIARRCSWYSTPHIRVHGKHMYSRQKLSISCEFLTLQDSFQYSPKKSTVSRLSDAIFLFNFCRDWCKLASHLVASWHWVWGESFGEKGKSCILPYNRTFVLNWEKADTCTRLAN